MTTSERYLEYQEIRKNFIKRSGMSEHNATKAAALAVYKKGKD